MKLSLVFGAVVGLGSAAICNNNCGRAVAGTARQSPPLTARKSQCQAFLSATVTVTPGAVTVTANPVAGRNVHGKRQAGSAPEVTGSVPGYASACADVTSYWLACQCFSDVAATTVTVTAATPVITVTGSPQSSSASTVVSSTFESSEVSSTTTTSAEASSTEAPSEMSTETSTSETSTSQTPSSSLASSDEPSSVTATPTISINTSVGSTCTPTAVLPNPTSLISAGDDQSTSVVLPFAIGVFGNFEATVFVSINGRLSLYDSTNTYTNVQLPDPSIPSVSILAFYDDLIITSPNQVVAYQVFGSSPGNRSVTFEWVAEHFEFRNQFYHFDATFEEAQPGIVTYRYYTTTDKGLSATIGAQNLRSGRQSFVQYAFNTVGSIQDRSFLRLDTTGEGTFTTGRFETSEC